MDIDLPDVPRIGLGTYQNTDREECAGAVAAAIDVGYEHVDTAQGYDNEAYVGEGIDRSSASREELFVASKISTGNLGYDDAVASTRESAEKLGVDSLDLMYVHWPINTYDPEETLPALDDLYDEGTIDAVGLSNFTPELLEEALERLDAPMIAHQVECHPLLQQERLRELAREHGHWLVAYCPIARNQVADVPLLQEIAEKHDATPAQVSLAWLLSKDEIVVIPKARGDHIRQNWEAQNLELDDDDLARIDDIDEERRIVDFEDAPWN